MAYRRLICLATTAVVLALCATTPAFTQATWTHQAPAPVSLDLKMVHMLSPTDVWIVGDAYVGDDAVVIHTEDGGKTWDVKSLPTTSADAIFFIDAQHGWIAGNAFFRTVDGGDTWVKVNDWGSIQDLFFVDTQRGWACGNGGTTYRTTDGGQTWAYATVGPITTLSSIFFQDAQTGFTASISGEIYRSTNGGQSWSNVASTGAANLTVQFVSPTVGFAIGGSSFLRTTDGGSSWAPILGAPTTSWIFDAYFVDAQHGFALGTHSVRTTDGGQTWQPMPDAESYQYLTSVHFADSQTGLYVGETGIVRSSTDGGATWSSWSSGGTGATHEIDAVDAQHAFAANDGGEVLRTTDGGAHWERAYLPGLDKYASMEAVAFVDTQTGWAGGIRTTFATGDGGRVFKTTDGGQSWVSQLSFGSAVHALAAPDAQTVFAIGENYTNKGWVMRTTNGGQTWVDVSPSKAFQSDVFFLDANTGWTCGALIYKTTNGGQTWQVQHVGSGSIDYLESISMSDAQHGWAVGWFGTVLRTTDGGQNWVPNSVPPGFGNVLLDVKAVDNNTAWIVGGNGYAAVTTNGGQSWSKETFAAGFVYGWDCVDFVDADRGFVGGASVFPHGGIWARAGQGSYVCQEDLGYDGHGMLTLSMCGGDLSTGTSATLEAHNAPPFAPLFLLVSKQSTPTYVNEVKTTLVPWPPLAFAVLSTGGLGSMKVKVPGGTGPATIFLQAVAVSPLDYSGFTTSSALKVVFLP